MIPNKKHKDHPLQQFKLFRERVKDALRKLSDEELKQYCLDRELDEEPNRTAYLRAAITFHEEKFLNAWKEKHGWDFSDVKNPYKFKAHLQRAKAKEMWDKIAVSEELERDVKLVPIYFHAVGCVQGECLRECNGEDGYAVADQVAENESTNQPLTTIQKGKEICTKIRNKLRRKSTNY